MSPRIIIGIVSIFLGATALVFVPAFVGSRPLTATEQDIIAPLYEDRIDLHAVRINMGGPLTLVYPGVTLGNTISFPHDAYDITEERYQALLVHEVCHVWQYQTSGLGYIPRSLWETISERDTYVVHYDEHKTLDMYDVEEQCEIFAEFFLTHDERYAAYVATASST